MRWHEPQSVAWWFTNSSIVAKYNPEAFDPELYAWRWSTIDVLENCPELFDITRISPSVLKYIKEWSAVRWKVGTGLFATVGTLGTPHFIMEI